MTRDLLHAIGEALYGERWQVPLARDLGVSERNMRYWVAGRPIPDIRDRLYALLSARSERIEELIAKLVRK